MGKGRSCQQESKSLSYGDVGAGWTHGAVPLHCLPSSQQSAILGLLEPEVVSLCLIALDGFCCSCLLLFLACIYAKEQQQGAALSISLYTDQEEQKITLNLQS